MVRNNMGKRRDYREKEKQCRKMRECGNNYSSGQRNQEMVWIVERVRKMIRLVRERGNSGREGEAG